MEVDFGWNKVKLKKIHSRYICMLKKAIGGNRNVFVRKISEW